MAIFLKVRCQRAFAPRGKLAGGKGAARGRRRRALAVAGMYAPLLPNNPHCRAATQSQARLRAAAAAPHASSKLFAVELHAVGLCVWFASGGGEVPCHSQQTDRSICVGRVRKTAFTMLSQTIVGSTESNCCRAEAN